MELVVATCYFPVDADIRRNGRYLLAQMRMASKLGADVAHFPEAALSGYAGTDFTSFRGFHWELLESTTHQVQVLSRQMNLWVILGSAHRLTGQHKPHDCVYIINSRGIIVDRYDKMFCGGDRNGRLGDLAHYSPGNHLCVFTLKRIRCGVLICYEYAFPELYREYKRRGVQLIFHSFHAGHAQEARVRRMGREVGKRFHALNKGASYPEIRMPASVQAASTANYLWISCSNTSARHSCFPGFFVRADGIITGRLKRNRAGVLISTVNTRQKLYDGTADWRARAMDGILHSGITIGDPRSDDRTHL